jgi:hypothetical protein
MTINEKPIRIVSREAIKLAKLRAQREGRSAANAASVTIIEALGKKPQGGNPPGPDFLAKCHCKDTGAGPGGQVEKT